MNPVDFARDYLLPRRSLRRDPHLVERDYGLVVTGEALVQSIVEAIRLRRSVLVTGPRGCGKTWCVKEAIKRACDEGTIGGWHFLQGNREIPRDYISEDMLIIDRQAQPRLEDALVIRPPATAKARERTEAIRKGSVPPESRGAGPVQFPSWPAIPAMTLHELRREKQDRHWTPWAEKTDWVVLFLDEINRFGDGFLDSLLSLTEEGIVVRGGDEYHVPVVVVATANPPGYDVTAKKLSPPLQARIGRSYRVSQPPLDHLVQVVVPSKAEMLGSALGAKVGLAEKIKYLASAATLCLWGNPDAGVRGAAFLTAGTRALLRQAMERSPKVKSAMTELSGLVQFGPDARAIGEWIGAAAGEAQLSGAATIEPEHLLQTAGAVLGHKLRESFNEGSEPEKVSALQRCIHDIVATVLTKPAYADLFVLPYERAAERLGLTQAALLDRLAALGDERRWHPWLRAIADLDDEPSAAGFAAWRRRNGSDRPGQSAFTMRGDLLTFAERRWFERVLLADRPAGAKDEPGAAATAAEGASRRAALLALLGTGAFTNVELSARQALEQTSCASYFTRELIEVARRNEDFLKIDGTGKAEETWVEAVDRLIDPHGGEVDALLSQARQSFQKLGIPADAATRALAEAMRAVQGRRPEALAMRERAADALRKLSGR